MIKMAVYSFISEMIDCKWIDNFFINFKVHNYILICRLQPSKAVANILHGAFQNIVHPTAFSQATLDDACIESYWEEFKVIV